MIETIKILKITQQKLNHRLIQKNPAHTHNPKQIQALNSKKKLKPLINEKIIYMKNRSN